MDRLKAYLDDLKAAAEPRKEVEGEGTDEGDRSKSGGASGAGGGSSDKKDDHEKKHEPAAGKRASRRFAGIPTVNFTEDAAILEEMTGRAALYRREENIVFLNPRHFKYLGDLEKIYEDCGSDGDRRALAKRFFDQEYMVNAGKLVIVSWIFKGKADWNDKELETALGMGSLTLHLADSRSLDEARRKLRQKLTVRKVELEE